MSNNYVQTLVSSPLHNRLQFFIFKDTLEAANGAVTSPGAKVRYMYKCTEGNFTLTQGNVVIQQSNVGLISIGPLDHTMDITVQANDSDITSYVLSEVFDTYVNVEVVSVTTEHTLQHKQYALIIEGEFTAATVGDEARGALYENNGPTATKISHFGNTSISTIDVSKVPIVFCRNESVKLTGNGTIVAFYGSGNSDFA